MVQFKSLEKRLEKDLNLKTQYASDIRNDFEKCYVVPVSPHDSKNSSDQEWYVLHHPVSNPNKPGKVRRFLNGASKFHGKSLNNSLLVGPDLLRNLFFRFNGLLRAQKRNFRRYRRHVYAGRLTRKRSTFLALFVVKDPTSDVSVFQYTRQIFGAKDSPTCANYALRRSAVDNRDRYPDAAYAVLNNFYMDDYLGSVKNPETVLMLSRSLVELLKLGGFNLTKFISNFPNLSSKLNPP